MPLANILWIDDETESLESHRRFLEARGYHVHAISNGHDALEFLRSNLVDVVLLDESMPGLSGLETLSRIQELARHLPVIMITRNETEGLMDEAIGSQINDYLIKPVNPHQVLLSLKKIIENKRLISEKTASDYQQQMMKLYGSWEGESDPTQWMEIFKRLTYWELAMGKSDNPEMLEIHQAQKHEANAEFFRFVSRYYSTWIEQQQAAVAPVMSHTLFRKKVFPFIEKGRPLIWLVIDNLRYDQWKAIESLFSESFRILEEDTYYSILPTATHYSRNALFSGLLPADMQRQFPALWHNEDEEGSKNDHEEEYLKWQLGRLGHYDTRFSYQKIVSNQDAQRLADNAHNLLNFDMSVIVYNFVDMLSHARTEMEVLKELAGDEASYRSLTQSWFMHSPLHQALKKISEKRVMLVLSTDHGSIRVKNPCKVIGDRLSSTNIRYKQGRNLDYSPADVLAFKDPKRIGLPSININTSYIFAKPDYFLCYPNNYNHFANYYRNTFQHGGVSMEEMVVPVVRMCSK